MAVAGSGTGAKTNELRVWKNAPLSAVTRAIGAVDTIPTKKELPEEEYDTQPSCAPPTLNAHSTVSPGKKTPTARDGFVRPAVIHVCGPNWPVVA